MKSEAVHDEAGRWDSVAALALCACIFLTWTFGRVFSGATSLDRSLALIASALAVAAWCIRDSRWFIAVQCSIPLLIGCAIIVGDPRLRAIGFGAVAACAFCGALLAAGRMSAQRMALFVIAGVALLRWIAREKVEVGREGLIAIGCVLVALAVGRTAWGVALALMAALFAPAIPSRTVAIPYIAALVVWIIRIVLLGLWRREAVNVRAVVDAVAVLLIAIMILLFPWSGIAARTLPYFWRGAPGADRVPLHYALVPGQTIDINVPEGGRTLVVSAANALSMKPGTILGRIEPGPTIRIGDVADWGYARRDQYWKSADVLPRKPAGVIHGYGYDAWIDGAGAIALSPRARRIRVTADRSLPADARLQIEFIELGRLR